MEWTLKWSPKWNKGRSRDWRQKADYEMILAGMRGSDFFTDFEVEGHV